MIIMARMKGEDDIFFWWKCTRNGGYGGQFSEDDFAKLLRECEYWDGHDKVILPHPVECFLDLREYCPRFCNNGQD